MKKTIYEIYVDNAFEEAWETKIDAVTRALVIEDEVGHGRVDISEIIFNEEEMEQRKLEWIADDDFETKHAVSEAFAIKTLKALYDEWPGGLEEIEAAMNNLCKGQSERERLSKQVIQELTAQYKETVNRRTIYVLTEEYNAYDQYGEYFVHAWVGKPNKGQLHEILYHGEDLDHILNGGGRVKFENHWYNLREL